MPTLIPEFTHTPSRQNPATFSADMDSRLSEENSRIIAMNAQSAENNLAVTTTSTNATNAAASAANAATSAASAQAAANTATAVIIPTTATYSYTQQDWRQSMMSKAEFNAVAAERRANRAGSGADNFGKGSSTATLNVNEGIYTSTTVPNTFYLGKVSGTGTSKTDAYVASINGSIILAKYLNTTTADATLLLPPAPTVLPSTATLTQQQIDSGVIKHADASNSGLIVNGKFDTDTSGWTGTTSTLSVVSNAIRVTLTSTTGYASQSFVTVIGKKYTVEYSHTAGTSVGVAYVKIGTSAGASTNATSTSVAGRNVVEFTATATTTYISLEVNGASGEYDDFDNIAVFPADAISRSDLVFLESWHEDVSEKDFVYPLGNVQYLGTTGDAGTTVAGAFAGSATYSLFSDTWQADSALIGKGYVWSTLSDANKKAFVANPENNCYLDGDKVIQVRYRMRVVMGWSDSWASVDTQAINYLQNQPGVYVRPKGKLVATAQADSGYNADANGVFGNKNAPWTNLLSWNGDGHFVAADAYGDTNGFLAGSYNGQLFALPIALVHRRNQGFKHDTYNPNGTKLASDSLPWHSTTVPFTSIADCFTESKLLATSGYIGTTTGRSDTLFYDQIHESDITDLRMNSRGINDYMRTMDTYMGKLQADTYRGAEGEKYTESKVQTTTGTVATVEVNDGTRYSSGSVIYIYDITASAVKGRFTVKSVSSNTLTVDVAFAKLANNYLISGASSTRTKSNTITIADVIGNPANYPATWKSQYTSLTSLHTAEDGTSLLPTGTTGSDGLATYKLSRKANATPLQVIKSTDSGVTWTALTVTTHYTFSTTTNAITFTAGNIPLTTDLIRVTYQTHTVMATATTNSEAVASGRAIAMNGVANGHLGYSLIGKVMTASTSPYVQDGYGAWGYRIDPTTLKFSTTSTEAPMHTAFTLGGMALGVPAVKTGMYITRSNGKAYLNLVFKEIKHNGTSVGDDAKFNIVDNVSTTTDNNAQTVLIGTKRVELPYFISAAE